MKKSELRQIIREEISKVIIENVNYDKWRRVHNKKPIARIVVYIKDPWGNKKRYVAFLMYKETQDSDVLYFSERLMGEWEGSGTPFSVSNLQNQPRNYFGGSEETTFYDDEAKFNEFIDNLNNDVTKTVEKLYEEWFEETIEDSMRAWFNTGVYKIDDIKIFLNK